jgi:hypothetical protein
MDAKQRPGMQTQRKDTDRYSQDEQARYLLF